MNLLETKKCLLVVVIGLLALSPQSRAQLSYDTTTATVYDSSAFGQLTTASGEVSTAFGAGTVADSYGSTAFGVSTTASNSAAVAFGWMTFSSGTASTAFGIGTVASGTAATAFGEGTLASGMLSTAFGYWGNTASSDMTTAFGIWSTASASCATAFGYNSTASGFASTAWNQSEASGDHATSWGEGSLASGTGATAFGFGGHAGGNWATASGYQTWADAAYSFVIGEENVGGGSGLSWVSTDPIFEIGNGVAGSYSSDAMVVYKNGNTTITGTDNELPNQLLIGSGSILTKGLGDARYLPAVGDVGIGNSSPSTLLEVGSGGSGKLAVNSTDSTGGELQIGNPTSNGAAGISFISGVSAFGDSATSGNGLQNIWNVGAGIYGMSGSTFAIGSGAYNGAALSITSGGSVGIGTANPLSALDVNGGVAVGTYAGTNAAPPNGLIVSGQVGIGVCTTGTSLGASSDGSGGTIATYSYNGTAYRVHTFSASGTFTVPSSGVSTVNVIVVGGGGGAGFKRSGGGGGGGVISNGNYSVTPSGTITVSIGSGGAGSVGTSSPGGSGSGSTFGTISALGGGGGGTYGSYCNGQNGSSGGGAEGSDGGTGSPGSGTTGQGYAGGNASGGSGGQGAGGGGGGAGGVGGSASGGVAGGMGGMGICSSISGAPVYYGGGGGGGGQNTGGVGGLGGGGNGTGPSLGGSGVANTGGGGGGGGDGQAGGSGGSGVVIVSYPLNTYGTTIPGSKLNVCGNISVGDATFAETPAPSNGAIIKGEVGIGTTTPAAMLDVNGTSYVRGSLVVTGTNVGGTVVASGTNLVLIPQQGDLSMGTFTAGATPQ